jgi:diadenosine tetraphosphate (Ap4A) HIT family hydrolase
LDGEQDCLVCRKHRGELALPGGAIFQDDLLFVSHSPIPEGQADAYLGTLLVEPRRHIAGLADLTFEEGARIGGLLPVLSRALRAGAAAEHVYLFVLGHHVPHLHFWLVPRYPGTPRQYWGVHVDEWPEAPRGDAQAIVALSRRIRAAIQKEVFLPPSAGLYSG